jgi:hypothetical protein
MRPQAERAALRIVMARLADAIILRSVIRPIPARRLGLVMLQADELPTRARARRASRR